MEKLEIDGFVPVYKAQPPFMKYENGFGYKGLLLEDIATGKLQCHLCGHLANNISKHLFHKHKEITPNSYKQLTGLNRTTPLLSPTSRKKIKNNFLNLTDKKRKEIIERLKDNNKSIHRNGTYKRKDCKGQTQMENRFGTCPEQCKAQFMKEYKQLGRIPGNKEMSGRLRHMIYSRFDNYQQALTAWGISENEYRAHITNSQINAQQARAEMDYFPKFSADDVKNKYQEFYFKFKRLPTWNEVKEYGLPGRSPFMRVFGKNKSEIENSFKVNELSYN